MAGVITSGMDIELVRQLAAEMTRAADEIQQLTTRVSAKLEATPWEGPDRAKFEGDWRSRQTAQLNQVMQALRDGAQTATTNSTEQEATSNR